MPNVQILPFTAGKGSLSNLLQAAGPGATILHYVPHAYNRKGVPFWLPRELEAWHSRGGGGLFVVFHELISRGGKLGHLYGPLSAIILRRVVRLTSGWVTTCDRYRDVLVGTGRAAPSSGVVLPVGSNIAPETSPVARRPLSASVRVVAFGLPETRLKALATHRALLTELEASGRLASLTLVGAAASQSTNAATAGLVAELGITGKVSEVVDAPEARISNVLLASDLGLCHMPEDLIGRSGVHAAYVAHGVSAALRGDTLSVVLNRAQPSAVSWEGISSTILGMVTGRER